MQPSLTWRFQSVILFIWVSTAEAQAAPFQDYPASDPSLSSASTPPTSSGADGAKWLQLEKVARDAVEQAAATEAFVAGVVQNEESTQEREKLTLLQEKEQLHQGREELMLSQAVQMKHKMIDGLKQAVAVMRVRSSQEALTGNAAKVRLGCAFGCSGHGTCDRNAQKCACSDGWIGEMCDQPQCPDDCSGNGLCVSGKCKCHDGWHGHSCEELRCPNDCSGNGYCFEGECMCNESWGGANCATLIQTRGELQALLRRSVLRKDTISSPSDQHLDKATAITDAPPVDRKAPEVDLEDVIPEVDESGKSLPWQHVRAKAMHAANRMTGNTQHVEATATNAATFQGTPLTAPWIASSSSDARYPSIA